MVRDYARTNGIKIERADVIQNKYSKTSVGCKIIVEKHNARKLKDVGFWPDPITCKDWISKHKGSTYKYNHLEDKW